MMLSSRTACAAQVDSAYLTLYMYSKPEWQQCASFQNGSSGLRWVNYTGPYRLVGLDELQTLDAHSMQSAIINTATNQTGARPLLRACPPRL
jgi:hypothetical protein